MIKINEKYTLVGKDLNLIVECIQDSSLENKDVEKNYMKRNKYFSTYEGLYSFLDKLNLEDNENITKAEYILEKLKNAYEEFKNIDIGTISNKKIEIGDFWYLISESNFYRLVKKEFIKKSRFTKEENIGKDKFITYGFVPNVPVGLKIISNEIIIEFLSRESEDTMDELDKTIDNYLLDVQNLKISDTNNDIEYIEDEEDSSNIEDTEDDI